MDVQMYKIEDAKIKSFMMQEGNWCPKEDEEWRVTYMQFACRRIGNTRSARLH
jgi:hypothetical protein